MSEDADLFGAAKPVADAFGCTIRKIEADELQAICGAVKARRSGHLDFRFGWVTWERGWRAITTMTICLPHGRALTVRLWGDEHRASLFFWHRPRYFMIDGVLWKPWAWRRRGYRRRR